MSIFNKNDNMDFWTNFNNSNIFTFPQSSGDFNTTGDYNFESDVDGPAIIKTFHNFSINTHHIVTTTNRCKGLYLNILGDCLISGKLMMTARGASAIGKFIRHWSILSFNFLFWFKWRVK